MKDEPVHVVGEVGRRHLGGGAGDTDGADDQVHRALLPGEDMLDASPDAGLLRIGPGGALGHRPSPGLLAVDAADPAVSLEPGLVGLTAVGSVRSYVGRRVVGGDDIPEHAAVEGRGVGDLALADEAEGPADRYAALVAKARDGDVDAGLAVFQRPRLSELQRPTRIRILLRRPGRLVRPDLGGSLAGVDRRLLLFRVPLLGCCHQGRIDDLPPSACFPAMLRIAGTLAGSAHGHIATLAQLPVEGGEQCVDGPGPG